MADWDANFIIINKKKTPKQTITALLKRMPGVEMGQYQFFAFSNFIPEPKNIDYSNAFDAEEGKVGWYKWRIKNWGTKWSPINIKIIDIPEGDLIIEFWTANGDAELIMTAIEKRYPTLVADFESYSENDEDDEDELDDLLESEWYLGLQKYIISSSN